MDGLFFTRRMTIPIVTSVLLSLLVPVLSRADVEAEAEELMGYDAIVQSLSQETVAPSPTSSRSRVRSHKRDPFEDVWIHGGVGLATFMQNLTLENGRQLYLNQRGVQASLGIDLFSENWMAEGTARSFSDNAQNGETNSDPKVRLQEFDMKVMFKDRFSRHLGYRAGGGLTARYLTVFNPDGTIDYTTPSSVGTFGLDLFLSPRLSIGLDTSARYTMISETIDRASYDATLRLDAHF